jgi:basic membrane protein A
MRLTQSWVVRSTQALTRYTLTALLLAAILGGSLAEAQDASPVQFSGIDRAALEETYVVNARALNFRPEPSLRNEPLTVVQQNEYVLKLGQTFNDAERIEWFNVRQKDGREGWVSSKYLDPVADALALVEGGAGFLATLGPAPDAANVAASEELKVGFLYVSPIGDAGWTYSHDRGRQSLETLPYVAGTSYIDSVPEEEEQVGATLDRLVAEGNNLIFGASYGYMDPMIAAAKRHPDTVFMHASGFKTAPNVGTYFGRMYEARYLAGMVAGGMTESKVIGYVAAFPIPEVIRGINAFTLGAQTVDPELRVKVTWTKTWYGPGIERERAEKLIDGGADVITIHQDSPSAIQVAEQRGVYAIGYHSDMSPFAHNATLTSAIWDWGVLYQEVAKELHEGSWKPNQLWWGTREGIVGLAPISPHVPAALVEQVEAKRQAIIEGRFRVFDGPVRDSDGEIRIPSGKTPSDADLLTMDYYVLGVDGGIAPNVTLPEDNETG